MPDGGTVIQEYNVSGVLAKQYGARIYPSEYVYDHAGRMLSLTTWQDFDESAGEGVAGAAVTAWEYNAAGQPLVVPGVRMGLSVRNVWDGAGYWMS